jgi:hypothetical protein
MGAVPEKVGVNRCSRFCALKFLLCVNVQRTLAQIRHTDEPDSFMERAMKDKPTYLYAIRCGEFVKVGIAECTHDRLSGLRVACPYPIELIGRRQYPTKTAARVAERLCHQELAGQAHMGEWFTAGSLDPLAVIIARYAADYPGEPIDQAIDPRLPDRPFAQFVEDRRNLNAVRLSVTCSG